MLVPMTTNRRFAPRFQRSLGRRGGLNGQRNSSMRLEECGKRDSINAGIFRRQTARKKFVHKSNRTSRIAGAKSGEPPSRSEHSVATSRQPSRSISEP